MQHSNTKTLSIFLGVLIFMFGFLKFFQPFYGWFEIQIQKSGLPYEAILLGKLGENCRLFWAGCGNARGNLRAFAAGSSCRCVTPEDQATLHTSVRSSCVAYQCIDGLELKIKRIDLGESAAIGVQELSARHIGTGSAMASNDAEQIESPLRADLPGQST